MKYLDFEKHIKNELGNSKEPVQMDALLASLNLGKKEPRRKGFALWMLLPFLLLAIMFTTWKTISTNEAGSNLVLSQEKNFNNFSKNVTPGPNNQLITAPISDHNNEKESSKKIENENPASAISNAISDVVNTKAKSKSSLKINSNSSNSTQPIEHSQIQEDESPLHVPLNSANLNDGMIPNSNPGIQKTSGSIMPTKPLDREVRDLLIVEDLNSSIQSFEERSVDGDLFKRMKINCPSFDNSGWHLALIPEIGVFKPFKTLENSSPEESAAFNERIQSEQTLEGLEVGLHGMVVRDNVPLYLKAGVAYSRISERMELKYEYIEMDTTIGIISSTVSANGDTITHIYGDIITATTFKGSNRQHHYIHLFDIPVSLGYSTYIAGLDIGIEAGVRLNFMTRATGNLLVSGNEYSNLSLNRLFKNRVGLSYTGGLMIGRNFGRYGDFYIAPRFTYYPDNFNNQNNSINQKYFNVGINAGVVYKIN